MNIYDTATMELRLMHEATDLMDLEQVSREYAEVERQISQLENELMALVADEIYEKIVELRENCTTQETIAAEIYYRQGFSDAFQLMLEALIWRPVRR